MKIIDQVDPGTDNWEFYPCRYSFRKLCILYVLGLRPRTKISMTLIKVTADDRERGAGVIRALKKADEVKVDVQRLGTGDYMVGDRLVFERKTPFLPESAACRV